MLKYHNFLSIKNFAENLKENEDLIFEKFLNWHLEIKSQRSTYLISLLVLIVLKVHKSNQNTLVFNLYLKCVLYLFMDSGNHVCTYPEIRSTSTNKFDKIWHIF